MARIDQHFIDEMINTRGAAWVAQAIENALDVKLGRAVQILPVFDMHDRVYYKDNDTDDMGTVVDITVVDNMIWYKVRWDDGEPTDLYTQFQIVKVKS
jgi:hypothetical protein